MGLPSGGKAADSTAAAAAVGNGIGRRIMDGRRRHGVDSTKIGGRNKEQWEEEVDYGRHGSQCAIAGHFTRARGYEVGQQADGMANEWVMAK